MIQFCTIFFMSKMLIANSLDLDSKNVSNIQFCPEKVESLTEKGSTNVKMTFLLAENRSDLLDYQFQISDEFFICYKVDDPSIASISFIEHPDFCDDLTKNMLEKDSKFVESNITINGIFLGRTRILATVFRRNNKTRRMIANQALQVSVIRDDLRLQKIFVATLSILIVLATILMGAQLNLKVVTQVITRPVAPLIGFGCQYVIMPLVSYMLASLIFIPANMHTLALALFTTGCSPGGGASNGYTVLMDGNVDLSITMTFFSTLAATVMMPFWMFLLGNRLLSPSFDESKSFQIPYANIFFSLLALVIPLLIGILVRSYHSGFAEKANKCLRPFLLFVITFICTFGIYVNFYIFRIVCWRTVLAGMCLPGLGFIFGTFLALICGQPLANIKAIGIETGIQNTGISYVLLQILFGQPDADLAAVVPAVVALSTPPPLLIALAVMHLCRYRSKKDIKEVAIKETQSESGDP